MNLKTVHFNWRVNHQIRAPEVRLIGSDGKQVGVLPTHEALSKSQKEGLDLVEIAPNAKPPVAKIVELGKFLYQEEKKKRLEKKKSKPSEVKEIRFSPFIADHDAEVRFQRIQEFLDENDKIRLVVVFKGRQMGSKVFGYDLLKRVVAKFQDRVVVDMEPKFLGRHLTMVISPIKKSKKEKITY